MTNHNYTELEPKSPTSFRVRLAFSIVFLITGLCFIIDRNVLSSTSLQLVANNLQTSKKNSKPNFVFILVDDMGFNGVGVENYKYSVATKDLSALAQNGLILRHYYAQEVCCPSRASLLTGRYPLKLGLQYTSVSATRTVALGVNETLISEVLSDYGYSTYILGKWHQGHISPRYLPTARGFDHFLGFLGSSSYHWTKKVHG